MPRRSVRRRSAEWSSLESEIVACTSCPRLIEHCREVARVRRRAYRDQTYWGRPVPGFGDPRAGILLVGLAPAAHGANRTGRMFTGDRSGDWLYGALHRAGLANRAEAVDREDGMRLQGAFIGAACRCAPPANRPSREEMERCQRFLEAEIDLLENLSVMVALGKIAWDSLFRLAAGRVPARVVRPRPRFAHAAQARLPVFPDRPPVDLLASYHPSQQNTQTGWLTRPMLDAVLRRAIELVGASESADRRSAQAQSGQ
jgi:uracil-DNA glycosylase family 4